MRKGNRPQGMDTSKSLPNLKLMACGWVCLQGSCAQPAEVRRGMLILSKEGLELGKVAAVVIDSLHHKTTHVLLSRLPEKMGYWMVPVIWVEEVVGESLRLSTGAQAAGSLREWYSP